MTKENLSKKSCSETIHLWHPQRRNEPVQHPLWLLVRTASTHRHELAYNCRWAEQSLLWWTSQDIFDEDNRDDFNFHITNFPFLGSNIRSSSAYGVFIFQLIRYAQACSSYGCFILRARWLSSKLLIQGYLAERLKSSFRKFYGRYGDLIQQYEVSLSQMLNDILILDQQWLPNQSDFPSISWPSYRAWRSPIMSGFHGAFATGVACHQGTLTLDTWFRLPLLDLLVLQLWRPDSSNLPSLYSNFHLEYSLVLSRFCLTNITFGIMLGSSTALYRHFLECCTLTNKLVGTIWRDLSKPI